MKHNLDLLKYIWDNRNLHNPAYQYLFNICIEPMKKGDWNRYTIWLNYNGNLINISTVIYEIVVALQLKDDIKLWLDTQYHCRPTRIETTGFASYLLHKFYDGISLVLFEQKVIDKTEVAEESYLFRAANYFNRLL